MVQGVRVVKVVMMVHVVRWRDLMAVRRLSQFERHVTEEAPVDFGRAMDELMKKRWLEAVKPQSTLMIQMFVWD